MVAMRVRSLRMLRSGLTCGWIRVDSWAIHSLALGPCSE